MYHFGARFSDDFYIRVDVESDLSDSVVTAVTEKEGEPVTISGTITWED